MDGTSTCLIQPDLTGQFAKDKDVKASWIKETSKCNFFDISEVGHLQGSTETTVLLN